MNQTSSTISMSCTPGYNGGLIQQIHMELFTIAKQCIANITGQINITNTDEEGFIEVDDDTREVLFTVGKLPSDEKYDIVFYASNEKGKSSLKRLKANTLPMISGEKGKIFFKNLFLFKSYLQ